jgi:hypothetical protein
MGDGLDGRSMKGHTRMWIPKLGHTSMWIPNGRRAHKEGSEDWYVGWYLVYYSLPHVFGVVSASHVLRYSHIVRHVMDVYLYRDKYYSTLRMCCYQDSCTVGSIRVMSSSTWGDVQ